VLNKVIFRFIVLLLILLIPSGVIPSCSGQATTSNAVQTASTLTTTNTGTGGGAGTGTSTASVAGAIKVSQGGQTRLILSPAEIEAIPAVTIKADGKDYTGPTIASILARAGISSFSKVIIAGYANGRLATVELPLEKAAINEQLIVRKTNQGTFSLASPNIKSDDWVIDVSELKVE
jgi:hypothetical protein